MKKNKGPFEPQGLLIGYKELGNIHIDEFAQAVITDIHALREYYHVSYVKGSKLRVYPTNEYGDPVRATRPEGGRVFYFDTWHYRPSCKDYDL